MSVNWCVFDKKAYKILTLKKNFWKFDFVFVKYTSMCLNIFANICFIFNNFVNNSKYADMQIRLGYGCQWGLSMTANEEMLAGIVDASYPDADPDAT